LVFFCCFASGKPAFTPIAPALTSESCSNGTRPGALLKLPPPSSTSSFQTGNAHGPTSGQKRPSQSQATETTSNTKKKRPYRRTKRPAGYNDRSTITTVTKKDSASSISIDAYDAMVAECEDLLNASLEAQQLGRLKMASAYQLLLHTRLVGLGKQFDRSAMKQANLPITTCLTRSKPQEPSTNSIAARHSEESNTKEETQTKVLVAQPSSATASRPNDDHSKASQNATDRLVSTFLEPSSSRAHQDAIMDATMMEHLARTAAELHHQRTGRKKSSEGLLASPMNNLQDITTPTIKSPSAAAATSNSSQSRTFANLISKTPSPADPSKWTIEEMDIVEKGMTKNWEPSIIAKVLSNKNEEQVREYLKQRADGIQQQQMKHQFLNGGHALSVARNSNVPTRSVPNAAGGGAAASSSTKAAAAKITQSITAATASDNDVVDTTLLDHTVQAYFGTTKAFHDVGESPTSQVRRGGRGRKPPTTAMNTVPTVSMDVRALLRGSIGKTRKEEE
jgi:hypothetical protein